MADLLIKKQQYSVSLPPLPLLCSNLWLPLLVQVPHPKPHQASTHLCSPCAIPTKSMGYMTYLRLTYAAICWVMISVIITFSIFSTSSLTSASSRRSTEQPSQLQLTADDSHAVALLLDHQELVQVQIRVRFELPHRLFQDHCETPSRFTWEDLRGKKSSGSCEGNESRRPRRG